MPVFLGLEMYVDFWTPKGGPPQFSTWMFVSSFLASRSRGAVGIAALLCRWQIAGGGSIPRWSASKTQDRRPAERQRARTKKNVSFFLAFVVSLFLVNFWRSWRRSKCHVATPKTGLPHAPTCGFGASVFGLACYQNRNWKQPRNGSVQREKR